MNGPREKSLIEVHGPLGCLFTILTFVGVLGGWAYLISLVF